MKKKVLVLGSTGLIGHQVYNYLNATGLYEMNDIAYRKQLTEKTIIADMRNEKGFIQTIKEIDPDYIINCIGILIEGSNQDLENAVFMNAYMPHRLMRAADDAHAQLIHISTDCVFSGDKSEPYTENDIKDGENTYARTKGLGEVINDRHVTLRTSVVGPELKADGEELFHWFMGQSGEIMGFTGALWSGVTTVELAKAVAWAVEKDVTGLYHITNGQAINKYDLLSLFKKYTHREVVIKEIVGTVSDKHFIDTRQERNYSIPSYDEMIREMIELMNNNKSLYAQYMVDDK